MQRSSFPASKNASSAPPVEQPYVSPYVSMCCSFSSTLFCITPYLQNPSQRQEAASTVSYRRASTETSSASSCTESSKATSMARHCWYPVVGVVSRNGKDSRRRSRIFVAVFDDEGRQSAPVKDPAVVLCHAGTSSISASETTCGNVILLEIASVHNFKNVLVGRVLPHVFHEFGQQFRILLHLVLYELVLRYHDLAAARLELLAVAKSLSDQLFGRLFISSAFFFVCAFEVLDFLIELSLAETAS